LLRIWHGFDDAGVYLCVGQHMFAADKLIKANQKLQTGQKQNGQKRLVLYQKPNLGLLLVNILFNYCCRNPKAGTHRAIWLVALLLTATFRLDWHCQGRIG